MNTRGGVRAGRVQKATRRRLARVAIRPRSLENFRSVLDPDQFRAFLELRDRARDRLRGRVVWNVNSTARGGGVGEMLASLLAYTRGADLVAR